MYSEDALAYERHLRRQDDVDAVRLAAAAKRTTQGGTGRRGVAHLVVRAGRALRRLVGSRTTERPQTRTVIPTTSTLRRA